MMEREDLQLYKRRLHNPLAVRYGWADEAGKDNLFNKEGFSAAPFRTDHWKSIIKEATYEIVQ